MEVKEGGNDPSARKDKEENSPEEVNNFDQYDEHLNLNLKMEMEESAAQERLRIQTEQATTPFAFEFRTPTPLSPQKTSYRYSEVESGKARQVRRDPSFEDGYSDFEKERIANEIKIEILQ